MQVNEPAASSSASPALVVAYLLYMMIRKRKGERPGTTVREPEL